MEGGGALSKNDYEFPFSGKIELFGLCGVIQKESLGHILAKPFFGMTVDSGYETTMKGVFIGITPNIGLGFCPNKSQT